MVARFEPGHLARRGLLRLALGAGGTILAATHRARPDDRTPDAKTADNRMEVKIDNFTFQPQLLRIKKGMEVTWVNQDDIPHSIVMAALQVHSHAIDTDGTFGYRFEKAGIYNYICGLHPHMKGQVVVSG